MTDLRPPFTAVLDAFGLVATVTPPGGPAVPTRAVWLPADTVEVPTGGDFRRAEPRRVLALPLDGLPLVPRGSVVTVPPYEGGDAADWRLDGMARVEFDHYRVVVLPVELTT